MTETTSLVDYITAAKSAVSTGDIKAADVQLQLLTQSPLFSDCVRRHIRGDFAFWELALLKYKMVIWEGTNPPMFTSAFPVEYFMKHVNSEQDVLAYFIHTMSHYWCSLMWRRCPISMSHFKDTYLDLIEDIYSQRLLTVVAPMCVHLLPERIICCLEFKGLQVTQERGELNSLLTANAKTPNEALKSLHLWLYSMHIDPLNPATFSTYIKAWLTLLKDPSLKETIDKYVKFGV